MTIDDLQWLAYSFIMTKPKHDRRATAELVREALRLAGMQRIHEKTVKRVMLGASALLFEFPCDGTYERALGEQRRGRPRET